MNPFNYTIEPVDTPTGLDLLILKPFYIHEREMIFQTTSIPTAPTITSLPFVSMSKILFISQFKSLLTTLKSQHCNISILDLHQDVLEKLFFSFESNTGLSSMSADEQVTLLFTILASLSEPLLPPAIAQMAKQIVQLDNETEVFKLIYCLLCMLPVTSHCILLELCQSITTYFPSSPSHGKATSSCRAEQSDRCTYDQSDASHRK